jgi:predicted ATPase
MKNQYIISAEIQKDKIHDDTIYPFNLPAFQNIDILNFHKNVTFIIGENGTGKSTLIEALATQY